MADNRFCADYAKRVAGCKKCKEKIEKGQLRLAKVTANPFSDGDDMKLYHHPACLFETFKRARATTKIIEEPGDIEGFQELEDDDKESIRKLIREGGKGSSPSKRPAPAPAPAVLKASPKTPKKDNKKEGARGGDEKPPPPPTAAEMKRPKQGDLGHKDNSFREFRRLCALIADETSYNAKTEVVERFFSKGSDGKRFRGDLYVWTRLLLPGVVKRIYNLQSRQLVKIFARIFDCSDKEMLEDLEAGDVAETVAKFFEKAQKVLKSSKSHLTIHQVDDFLDKLTKLTREEDQQRELTKIAKLCTANDLKMIVRLIKGDLRIQAGAKHILDGLHKDAYAAFNSSRNIIAVIDKILELRKEGNPGGALEVGCELMHPVQPMLAMACKSVDMAFNKCPNGMYAEIKYDGERVQLHKRGKEFKYFSRSLKPVLAHKVKPFAEFIPKAFPDGSDLILDAEVLMVDNKTGDPLPFGSLGVHKAAGFKDATPCLFVFDCIYYNGTSLMDKPVKERRKHLHDHMKEVGNHVKFSEMKVITKKQQLGDMIKRVLRQGLEGLVLKDMMSPYEPGKRHWLKVKKDYLNEGAMADSADLVVLGAWYGTGSKGGLMSIFLMGCYDKTNKKWCTVTKVHTGVDEATLDRLQGELKPNMVKIKQDFDKVPSWLSCTRQMTPDFVAKDPKKSPVWEITGAEFTKAELHTAGGISIRFPRITRRRDDKTWETATDLAHLKALCKASKEKTDFDIDYSSKDGDDEEVEKGEKKKGGKKPQKKYVEMAEAAEEGEYSDETVVDSEEGEAGGEVEMEEEDATPATPSCRKSYNKTHIEGPNGMVLDVVVGDLFKAPDTVSLAHCISQDCKMSKGIAKIFREKFGRVRELEESGTEVGNVAVLKQTGDRYIYNLVTKERYSDKPTYEALERSLESMREHAKKHGVKEIAMPKIGCGLDGLQWNAVRTLLKNVFLEEDIKLKVYSIDDNEEDEPSRASGTSPRKAVRSPAKPVVATPTKKASESPKKQQTIRDMFARAGSDGGSRGGKKRSRSSVENGSASRTDAESAARDSPPPAKLSKKTASLELPDMFSDCRFVLSDGVGEGARERLSRYVLAYGGEVLQTFRASDATHVVYPVDREDGAPRKAVEGAPAGAEHVTEAFLEDSIKLGKAQKVEEYRIAIR